MLTLIKPTNLTIRHTSISHVYRIPSSEETIAQKQLLHQVDLIHGKSTHHTINAINHTQAQICLRDTESLHARLATPSACMVLRIKNTGPSYTICYIELVVMLLLTFLEEKPLLDNHCTRLISDTNTVDYRCFRTGSPGLV